LPQAVKSGAQPYWCDDMVWSFAQRAEAIQDVPSAKKGAALMHLAYMHSLSLVRITVHSVNYPIFRRKWRGKSAILRCELQWQLGRILGDEEKAVQKLTQLQCPQSLATALIKRFSETQVCTSNTVFHAVSTRFQRGFNAD